MPPLAPRVIRQLVDRSVRVRRMLAGMLGHHLTAIDIAFLRGLPDGLAVDLDAQFDLDAHDPGMPSVLWSMLWESSRARGLGGPCLKRVTYHLRGQRFVMELDLSESPECGYLLRNPTVRITRQLVNCGDTMLDIGANAGFHALTAGLFFRRVVAFEPTPTTATRLERNIALSGFGHVTVERCALSNREGTAHFHIEPGHCGANRLGASEDPTEVPLRTIDALHARTPLDKVDFIKIDVEGHECEVLEGGQALVARDRPAIMAEFNEPKLFDRFRALLPGGYRPFRTEADGKRSALDDGTAAVLARDVLFVSS